MPDPRVNVLAAVRPVETICTVWDPAATCLETVSESALLTLLAGTTVLSRSPAAGPGGRLLQ